MRDKIYNSNDNTQTLRSMPISGKLQAFAAFDIYIEHD